MTLIQRPDPPSDHTSPSAIKLASSCYRAHAWRYIVGLEEPRVTWEEVKDIPRPTGADAVKAWNRLRRAPLGTECHRLLELWFNREPVSFDSEPGRIVLGGLDKLPQREFVTAAACEEQLGAGFAHWATDGALDYRLKAYVDFNAIFDANPLVIDYKTTSDFRWALSPTELISTDPQGLLYSLHAMRKHNTARTFGRWVYFNTEAPAGRAVDFLAHLGPTKKAALPILQHGAILVQRIRDRVDPNDLPPNEVVCDRYYGGKCPYHVNEGGDCNPAKASIGKIVRALSARGKEREQIIMGFKRSAAASGAIDTSGEGVNENEQSGSDSAGDTEPPAASEEQSTAAAQEAPKRGRPRKPAAETSGVGVVTVSFEDGTSLDLPKSSPLYIKAAQLHDVLFGE